MPVKILDPKISSEEIKCLLDYNPETGDFIWKVRRGGKAKLGESAGCISNGYVVLKILSRKLYAHRVAWLIFYGDWPDGEIDHIDNNKSNNSIKNLRLANRSENCSNKKRRSDNSSGYKGVRPMGMKWRADIMKDGKSYKLGVFGSKKDAYAAYCEAARLIHLDYHRFA